MVLYLPRYHARPKPTSGSRASIESVVLQLAAMPQVAVEDLTLPQLLRVLRRHGVTLPVVERPRSHYIALCQARGITSVDTFGISEIGVESFGGITLRGGYHSTAHTVRQVQTLGSADWDARLAAGDTCSGSTRRSSRSSGCSWSSCSTTATGTCRRALECLRALLTRALGADPARRRRAPRRRPLGGAPARARRHLRAAARVARGARRRAVPLPRRRRRPRAPGSADCSAASSPRCSSVTRRRSPPTSPTRAPACATPRSV